MRHVVLFFIASVMVALAVLPGCAGSCKPMELYGNNMQCNGGARGYAWTGTSCIYTAVCNCTGKDCQRLYSTQDACETAHFECK